MSSGPEELTCPLCGTHFLEADGQTCHKGCPLERGCSLLSCPECGYEMPGPTRLTRWMSKWFGKAAEG